VETLQTLWLIFSHLHMQNPSSSESQARSAAGGITSS
jgi:hypothetical protein